MTWAVGHLGDRMTCAPLKVLAIDDEQLLLWALEKAFKGRKLQINTASTTEQALAHLEQCHYDLFLLNFNLKDQKSQVLLEKIDNLCPYVPIIIMTTCDVTSCQLKDAVQSVRKQGAWHLLEKPFRLERLISFVELLFHSQTCIKPNQSNLVHNYDHEKRQHLRRPYVTPMSLRIKNIIDGENKEVVTQSIITDISKCGIGLLSPSPLERDQVIGLGGELKEQYGIVAWCKMIETNTCLAGIRLC